MSGRNTDRLDDVAEEDLSGPLIDRRTAVKLLGAAGLAGLAGCSGGGGDDGTTATTTDPGSESDSDPDSGGTTASSTTPPPEISTGGRLKAGWNIDQADTLVPTHITPGQYFQLASNVFNGLLMLKPDLTVKGDLARDWTVADGGTTLTFTLREGVKFHNGDEFTAEDVRYTIDYTISQETVSASKLSGLEPVDDGGVNVLGDYELEINLTEALAPILVYLTRGPGRAAAVLNQRAMEEMGDAYMTEPVGTGPFVVAEHSVGNTLTLDRFDDYFKTDENGTQLPYLDGVDVSFIPESSTLLNALRAGDVDFTNHIPAQNSSRIESSNQTNLLSAPGANWYGIGFNFDREPFQSHDARLGLAKLIDNEALVRTAFFGKAMPARGPFNKATRWVWRDDKPDDQAYAPDEGLQLLEEAGYPNASFDILTGSGSLRWAKVLRQQWNEAGLDVTIDQTPISTYWDRWGAGDFDAIMISTVADPDPEQSVYNTYRHPDEGGVWNVYDYTSETGEYAAEVNDLLVEQRRQLDRSARTETLQELEDYLIQEAAHVYLFHQDDLLGTRNNVNGFVHVPYMRYLETVWLDDS